MKRKLMLLERIMYVDAATPLNGVFTAKICGSINPENLATALFKIQQKHPLLRVRIDEASKGGPYFVSNEKIGEIPVRISERLTDDDWQREALAECHKLFDDENEPLARLVWLRSPAVSELLFVLPHCICDGSAATTLMHDLLTLLDDPSLQIKAHEPINSVQELMPDAFDTDKKSWKILIFSILVKLYFLLPNRRNKLNTGNDYILHWRLDKEQTLALARACTKSGASVHAALCVAFIKAFQQTKGSKARGRVISPVDIRLFIPQIKQDSLFAFAPIVELTIRKNTDFWGAARKMKEELTEKTKAINAYEMLWAGECIHTSANKIIRFLKTTEGSHDVTLSNMGRLKIQKTYKSFELETIYSPIVSFPWRNPNTLITTKFNNHMDFTFMSNDAFLEQAVAAKIRTIAMELLFANSQQSSNA